MTARPVLNLRGAKPLPATTRLLLCCMSCGRRIAGAEQIALDWSMPRCHCGSHLRQWVRVGRPGPLLRLRAWLAIYRWRRAR